MAFNDLLSFLHLNSFLVRKNILIINFTFVDIEWMIDTPFDTKIFQNACMSKMEWMDGRAYCNSLIGWSWRSSKVVWLKIRWENVCLSSSTLCWVGGYVYDFRFLNIAIKLPRRFIMGSWMVADTVTAKWASPVHQLVIVGLIVGRPSKSKVTILHFEQLCDEILFESFEYWMCLQGVGISVTSIHLTLNKSPFTTQTSNWKSSSDNSNRNRNKTITRVDCFQRFSLIEYEKCVFVHQRMRLKLMTGLGRNKYQMNSPE